MGHLALGQQPPTQDDRHHHGLLGEEQPIGGREVQGHGGGRLQTMTLRCETVKNRISYCLVGDIEI